MSNKEFNELSMQERNEILKEYNNKTSSFAELGAAIVAYISPLILLILVACKTVGIIDAFAIWGLNYWFWLQIAYFYGERQRVKYGIVSEGKYKEICIHILKKVGIFIGCGTAVIIFGCAIGGILGQPIYGLFILAFIGIRLALGD